jgi:hypothetical protein
MAYDINDMEQYIRLAARARGIDPDVAVRVARSEGLARDTWQSNVRTSRGREPSYGPFQLLEGGQNGWPTGLGNAFRARTGLDPSDPNNGRAGVDFALDTAAREGWGQWYGAKAAGINNFAGIGSNAAPRGVQSISPPGNGVAPSDLVIPPVMASNGIPVGTTLNSIPPTTPDIASLMGPANSLKGGLGLLAGAFGGQQQAPKEDTIQPMAPSDDGARMAAAAQLFNNLRAMKRKLPGLSLAG